MRVDPDKVFAQVETDRTSGELSKNVTTAKVTYHASKNHPDYIEQINKETGERLVGTFANGVFTSVKVESLPSGALGREFDGPDSEID